MQGFHTVVVGAIYSFALFNHRALLGDGFLYRINEKVQNGDLNLRNFGGEIIRGADETGMFALKILLFYVVSLLNS